jgi:hypothetical protein
MDIVVAAVIVLVIAGSATLYISGVLTDSQNSQDPRPTASVDPFEVGG